MQEIDELILNTGFIWVRCSTRMIVHKDEYCKITMTYMYTDLYCYI